MLILILNPRELEQKLGQKYICYASLLCSSYRWHKPPLPSPTTVYLAEVMAFYVCSCSSTHF